MNNKIIFILSFILICSSVSSCKEDQPIDTQPDQIYGWNGSGHGFATWGCGGLYMYGSSASEPRVFELWKWHNGSLKIQKTCTLDEHGLAPVWLTDQIYLIDPIRDNEGEHFLSVKNADTNAKIKEWSTGKGWFIDQAGQSRSGKYVLFGVREERTNKPEGFDREHPRVRLGLIDVAKLDEIHWLPMLVASCISDNNITSVMASDDGVYVAVAGWNYGAVVIDVVHDTILWKNTPKGEVLLRDITFAPDNRLVYAGGTSGCVYAMKIETGEVVSRWYANEKGRPVYGDRINAVAVSPDGQYVAAGSAPTGRTYIWSSQTGIPVRIVSHNSGILMMMFSPDSKKLATFDGGSIKLWEIPQKMP